MKNGYLKKFAAGALVAAMAVTGVPAVSQAVSPVVAARAEDEETQETPYGDSLQLNDDLQLGQTVTKNYKVKWSPKKYFTNNTATVKAVYKLSEKEDLGDEYKVTISASWKASVPKIKKNARTNNFEDFDYKMQMPNNYFTVFDYKTGYSLENENDLGVEVVSEEFKNSGKKTLKYKDGGSFWFKTNTSVKFTVTYPKDADIVIGLGVVPLTNDDTEYDTSYWDGDDPFGTCLNYKRGKNTSSFIRLNG